MPFLPCLLCGKKLIMRTDKNKKPYFVCDPCGIQLFIRRKQGIELLEQAFENLEKASIPFSVHARDLHKIQALMKEIDGVNTEIDKIGFWFLSDKEYRVRNALKTKLASLYQQLERMTKEGPNES